jgi:hypothetical protein
MRQAGYLHLDAVKDHEAIVKRMLVDTWKFDLVRATEVALLKTFAVPDIARILVDSREFLERGQKRFDDTDLLIATFCEKGYSSPEGMKAIQRVNRMHAPHPITNDQMLYVLTTFVVEPIVWIDAYGWRRLETVEKEALFHFWIEVGRRMGIKQLFGSLGEMLAFHESYEQQNMRFSANNAKLLDAMLPIVIGMMPSPFRQVTRPLMRAILSPRLCAAFGLKPAGAGLRGLVRVMLKARGFAQRLFPGRPEFRTAMARPTYPDGYKVEDLGVKPNRAPAPVRGPAPVEEHSI